MKKIVTAGKAQTVGQKLRLSRETLRRLEAPELEYVVGGTIVTCGGDGCQVSKTDCATEKSGI